jgi:cystathionine beta-lyase
MVYDFDTVYERDSTNSAKWSLRKELGLDDVLPLWVADMDFACPPEIVKAMRERVDHPLYGYTTSSSKYYNSLIQWMAKRHDWEGIQREWICFSPGVVSAFNFAIQAYSHPGDKVILQPPVYYPMKMAIDNNGRRMVENPLKIVNGKYVMDYEDLEKKIDDRTKMVILCSPHNPVGRVWTLQEIKQLTEICEKKRHPHHIRRDSQ